MKKVKVLRPSGRCAMESRGSGRNILGGDVAIVDPVGGGDVSLTEMGEHIPWMNVFDWNLWKYTDAECN